jgi:Mg/Co/Ni transporter MgtE
MGKMKQEPRHHVLSVRLNDSEKAQIEKAMQKEDKTAGDVVRDKVFGSRKGGA